MKKCFYRVPEPPEWERKGASGTMGSIFSKSPPDIISPGRIDEPERALANKTSDFGENVNENSSIFQSVKNLN